VGQSPAGQGADDTVDDQWPTSGIEVPCLKVLDRLAKSAVKSRAYVGCCQKATADQQLRKIGDRRAGVAE